MNMMLIPPPTPSQEGNDFIFKRARDCVAHPFDPWSLRASTAGASPQKKRIPLRGGGRGWRCFWVLPLAMVVLSTTIAASAGAAFENGLSARAYGLGQAMSAEVSDSTSVFWNPAGLADIGSGDIGLLKYAAYETDYISGQAATRIGDVGLGFGYISAGLTGIVNSTRSNGRAVATGETSSYGAHGFFLGAGARVWGELRAGITAKYLTESLAGYQATGFGVDLGFQYPVFSWLDAGLSVQNMIVPQMAWDTPSGIKEPVTLLVRPGLAMQVSRQIRVMTQVDWRENRGTQFLWGVEYLPMDMLAFRTGYNTREWSVGTGIQLGGLTLDLTWSTAWTESVSDTYRLGMGYRW